MSATKLLITPPPTPAPYERPNLQYHFAISHEVAEEAQMALAATALELLAAMARKHYPEAGSIEFEHNVTGTTRICALWTEIPTTPLAQPRALWSRGEYLSIRDHLWTQDMEWLLAPALNASALPVAPFGNHSPARHLLRLPAPDVAAALAASLRRQHPRTAALLISLDSEGGEVDIAVEHLIDPHGASLVAIPKERDFTPSTQQAWWWRTRKEVEREIRHLWRHPQHRARLFRPQGHESSFWNHGLQLLLLPAAPALPAGQDA
ncbi:hypothetical protein OH807_30865 [Kitasatospora sp. NBC_01560]|uniref:hypothetical protein n=1 Tax=Kitasatospora sp. NBC_01560 TaxID=2975965 RepID=UPI00386FD235